ncbi:hypothetical protein SS50377_21998 [Spironucleus salmonicida]|uniref:Uncharacterized protein n=1 Tax=Spironucleus salmonicida TaxID=348837 RepID=V6LMB8_9EUKA|nr:hypothetical protein SS50377_21998 [Spironucleus salmonicida]|eukprot:EST45837.1 Hypothetical protein SS50377_14412 [Spironucleus salmonicida]
MGTISSNQFFNFVSNSNNQAITKAMLNHEKHMQLSSIRAMSDCVNYQFEQTNIQIHMFNVTTSAKQFMNLYQNPSIESIFESLSMRMNISKDFIEKIYKQTYQQQNLQKVIKAPTVNKKLYFTLEYILLHQQIVEICPLCIIFLKIDYSHVGVIKSKLLCAIFRDEYNISEDKVLQALGASKSGVVSFQTFLNCYYRIEDLTGIIDYL